MPLFSSIDVPIEDEQNDSYIKLRFNDELKPYLIKLQSRYTSIDEEILASMDGVNQKVWGRPCGLVRQRTCGSSIRKRNFSF